MWEKKKGTTQYDKRTITCDKRTVTCDKNRTYAMFVLLNIIIEPSNLREKNKGTTICDKRTVKCDIGTAQCDNRTIKCKKKKKGNHQIWEKNC